MGVQVTSIGYGLRIISYVASVRPDLDVVILILRLKDNCRGLMCMSYV